ncbi:MAG: hypothetical protein IJ725_01465, partial [Ruminococcus sp.]|nr:hypothetical protein [Ruminococcus sp.]
MKKLTAILLAVLMIIGCFSVMAVSAAETATINVAGKDYTVDVGKTLTYTVNLKTTHPIVNFEFYLGYPQSILSVTDYDFPVVGKDSVYFNYTDNVQNEVRFNYSNQSNPIDFTNGGVFVTISFKVNAAGTGSIAFINEEATVPGQIARESVMSWVDENYIIRDELENATLTETLTGYNEPASEGTQSTESTQSTEVTQPPEGTQPTPVTQPTQPTNPQTTIKVKAAKTTIYVGGTTTVTATVTNKVGDTTFKSSNTKVATVTS